MQKFSRLLITNLHKGLGFHALNFELVYTVYNSYANSLILTIVQKRIAKT